MNKSKMFYVGLVLTCILSFSFALTASADTFKFRWNNFIGSTANIQASYDHLSSNYNGSIFSNALSQWNSSAAHFSIAASSFSTSTADLYSVDSTTWSNNGWGSTVRAWTQPFSTSGTKCATGPSFSDPDTNCPAGTKVNYAAIYFNEGYVNSDATYRTAVVAHELGHAVGLAHTTYIGAISIMDNALSTSKTVTSYDVGQVNSTYP